MRSGLVLAGLGARCYPADGATLGTGRVHQASIGEVNRAAIHVGASDRTARPGVVNDTL